MVACNKCSTENSLDSLFCRQCGEALAPDERSDARQKHERFIAEGYKIFNEGRTAEARLVAETALAENPNSTSALSLKGMCHERAGELALALAAFEKVVELNPDSALDKIKVTHLRQSISGRVLVDAEPRRGRALLGAAAATVLVVAVAVALASGGPAPKNLAMKSDIPAGTPQTDSFKSDEIQSNQVNKVATNTQAPPVSPQPGEAPVNQGSAGQSSAGTSNSGFHVRPNLGGRTGILPAVEPENNIAGGIGPVRPSPPPNMQVVPEGSKQGSDDLDPKIDKQGDKGESAPAKAIEDHGVIEIKVSNPRPNSPGGSTPISEENGVEALLKTGSQQFLLGRYGQAATTYESALRAGASSGSTNQRIAQAYSNNGNKDAAIAAYRRAISAYESSIARGNDSPKIRAALDSCKQALKVLGG